MTPACWKSASCVTAGVAAAAVCEAAARCPAAERPAYEAIDTNHGRFPEYLIARANSTNDFYNRAPGAVDLCGLPSMVRKVGAK